MTKPEVQEAQKSSAGNQTEKPAPDSRPPEKAPAPPAAASAARPASALYRSLILPGWGQIHRGEYLTGGAFMGLFLGSLAYTGLAYQDFYQAQASYGDPRAFSVFYGLNNEAAGLALSARHYGAYGREMRAARDRYNLGAALLLTSWAANVVHVTLLEGRVAVFADIHQDQFRIAGTLRW